MIHRTATFVFLTILLGNSAVWAADWYVRPAGGVYGEHNGTSYGNAWDSFEKVVWGESGVQAGDTIYICGTHVRNVTSGAYIGSQGRIMPGLSGIENKPIIISGKCSNSPGIIWGAWKDLRPGGMRSDNWKETVVAGVYYNETGIYNKAFVSYGLFEDIERHVYKKYKKLNSKGEVEASGKNGVFYIEAFGRNQHRIWLKPFNTSTFAENIRWSGAAGWRLVLSDKYSHVEFRDLSVYASELGHSLASASAGPYHHYSFINCKFFPLEGNYFYTPFNSYEIVFDGCEIAYTGNGIYVMWSHGPVHNILVRNTYFHDIGSPWGGAAADGHAIGVQNNEFFYLYNNKFERCGSAIDFHVGASKTQRHLYVVGNYIADMREAYAKPYVAPGAGILLEGSNDVAKGNTGNTLIAYNIVNGCDGAGIGSTRKDEVVLHNNTVRGCDRNYMFAGNRMDGASAKFYNNISYSPRKDKMYGQHLYFNQNYGGIKYSFSADNNLYYPGANNSAAFYFLQTGRASAGTDFNSWRRNHRKAGNYVDDASLIGNPLFENSSGFYSSAADFMLKYDSPAIDSGLPVISSQYDFFRRPTDKTPDIGAVEYQHKSQLAEPEDTPVR